MEYSAMSARKKIAGNQAKTLLKNVIRHTDTHNRLLEEADMWNMHSKIKEGSLSDRGEDAWRGSGGRREGSNKSVPHKDSNIKNSFLYDNRETLGPWTSGGTRGSRRAHMDDDVGDCNTEKVNESTFWMRQMYKAEAEDEDRWGHAGYKELYPHHFDSDRSEGRSSSSDSRSSSSGSDDSIARRRKRKRKKSTSRETHRKSKKRKKEEEFKKKKRKKKSDEDEGDDKKKRKKRKKEKGSDRKRRKKKKMRRVSSESENEDSSDDDKRKWRRK